MILLVFHYVNSFFFGTNKRFGYDLILNQFSMGDNLKDKVDEIRDMLNHHVAIPDHFQIFD